MKLAIISDVHSNLHALEVVKEDIERAGADRVICAGDVVGYCAFPNECCQIMRSLSAPTVLGNHDRAALTRETLGTNPYAAKAILWTADVLTDDSEKYLRSLEIDLRIDFKGKSLTMFHGSPRSLEEYVFPEDVDKALIDTVGSDFLVLGHTHVPFLWKSDQGVFINPGAVGQPRDGDPRASFALLNTNSSECEIRRLSYDIDAAADGILEAGLPGILAERLFVGR